MVHVSRYALLVVVVLLASCAADSGSAAPAGVVRRLAMSPTHTCAVREAGIYCWGANLRGELGNGTLVDSDAPMKVNLAGGSDDVVEIAAHSSRTCVRHRAGTVACWGANEQGQIGDGTRNDALTPVAVHGITDARQLAVQDNATCVARAEGRVSCWGGVSPDSPGSGSLVPVEIEGLTSIVEVRPGTEARFCARDEAGSIRCWQLRQDGRVPSEPIAALAGARSFLIATTEMICAIVADGEILCHNLSNGVTTPLMASHGSVELEGNTLIACARSSDGRWTFWNVLPPMLESVGSAPIPVASEVPLLEFAVGGLTACALREDQRVACVTADVIPPMLRLVENLPL